MNTAGTLSAYALGLVAVFGAATGLGRVVGPVGPVTAGEQHGHVAETAPPPQALPAGLAVSQDGYTLHLARTSTPAGRTTLSFTVTGPDGTAVADYTPTHEKDLHLVVVRRDLTAFQHVHPTRAAEGTWSVPLTLADPGAYKVFADFQPSGRTTPLVLGSDLTVAGDHLPRPLSATSRTATVDGYTVTLDGDLVPGQDSVLDLTVRQEGQSVRPQSYLGAFGHLVALRAGDLAYLHVHPEEGAGLRFAVEVPTAGDYRLFLDFRHGDVVRTTAFTVAAHAR